MRAAPRMSRSGSQVARSQVRFGRLLELGDGWMPMGERPRRRSSKRPSLSMKERAAERGRDPEAITFRYTIGIGEAERGAREHQQEHFASATQPRVGRPTPPKRSRRRVARFAEAGFTELAINFSGESAAEVMEQLEWFGEERDAAPMKHGLAIFRDGRRSSARASSPV